MERLTSEIQQSLDHLGNRLAESLYRSGWGQVRLYSQGRGDEPTWVGQCVLCKAIQLSNLDPKACGTLPEVCGGNYLLGRFNCSGNVLLHQDWEALLAAYLVGGWEAITDTRVQDVRVHTSERVVVMDSGHARNSITVTGTVKVV